MPAEPVIQEITVVPGQYTVTATLSSTDVTVLPTIQGVNISAGIRGPVGPAGADGPAGANGSNVVWLGEWTAGTYDALDGVQYLGSAWVANKTTTATPPSTPDGTSADWDLFVAKGDTGATGATGATGPQGEQGPQGIQGETGATGPQGPQGIQGEQGPQGIQGIQGETGPAGTDGNDGWTPELAIVSDGDRRVQQVVDWFGGEGTKPATGQYVGATGLVSLIADAVDIRGPVGSGSGDVTGPASSTTGNFAVFADTTGKEIADGGTPGDGATADFGSTAGTICEGNDARLSDARTPTAHASSHVTGGTDKIRDATASQDGLMTAAYASKLDGIEAGANAGITQLTGDVTAGPGSGSQAATIANDAVTFAKMQNISTQHLIGRHTAGIGDPEQVGIDGGLEFQGANIQRSALTGDVTASAGSNATTIANDAVSNAKLANMAEATIKGRASGAGTGDPTDLSATQATAILNAFVGDSGSGGTKGLVPAPAAGDAAAGKYLDADGTWTVPAGGGGGSTLQYTQLGSQVDITDNATLQSITGLSFSMAANTSYRIRFHMAVSASATSTGYEVGITGPASPTGYFAIVSLWNSATAETATVTNSTSYGSIGANANSGGGTARPCEGIILFHNGANAGTFQLQGKVENAVSGTVSFEVGSFMTWEEVTT